MKIKISGRHLEGPSPAAAGGGARPGSGVGCTRCRPPPGDTRATRCVCKLTAVRNTSSVARLQEEARWRSSR